MMAEKGIEEYVNVIIFAGIYGVLMVVAVGHLFVRWQYRRKSLNKWKPHVPGGGSFKNKRVRQQIAEDFDAIRNLSSDPRLTQESDGTAPTVSTHQHLLGTGIKPPLSTHDLPRFLNLLGQKETVLSSVDASDIISAVVSGYKTARYSNGVFTITDLEGFNQLLARLGRLLLSDGQSSDDVPIDIVGELTTGQPRHDKTTARYSQEPLLDPVQHYTVGGRASEDNATEERDVLRSLSHSAGSRPRKLPELTRFNNRPASLEIPLIDSQTSTPLGSTSSPFFTQKK